MEAVARAGFRAIALDMRGYGGSAAPVEAEAYTPHQTVGDLVAILDAAGAATASVVGHANVAWHAAMMRPDRFTAVCGRASSIGSRVALASWTTSALLENINSTGSR
jgi:pimeloyl-ACP methyl ester carboxylesterase